jgi:hypothetical protein
MKERMSALSWLVEVWTPRRSFLRVSSANQPSTWLIQEADVGVKMHVIARPPGQPCPDRCRFVGSVVIHDDVDVEIPGDLSVDLFEEVKEFGGTVPLVAFADDKAGGDVERCEQRGRAMPPAVRGNHAHPNSEPTVPWDGRSLWP